LSSRIRVSGLFMGCYWRMDQEGKWRVVCRERI